MLHYANRHAYEAVKAAFAATRRRKVIAKMAFSCCGSCGHYELGQRGKPYVFYHRQSAAAWKFPLDENNPLYIYHSDNDAAAVLVAELRRVGLNTVWNGEASSAVHITGMAEGGQA